MEFLKNAPLGKFILWLLTLLALLLLLLPVEAYESDCPAGDLKIYVSAKETVKTLQHARRVAELNPAPGYCILLKSGEVFETKEYTILKGRDDGYPDNEAEADQSWRGRVAFHWRLNKRLLLSTYGGEARATFRGVHSYVNVKNYQNKQQQTAKPQVAIAITQPSAQQVTISNITIENWEISAIHLYRTRNVTIDAVKIKKIGTAYYPDDTLTVFTGGKEMPVYAAGVIYPKFSTNITVKNSEIRSGHNKQDWLKPGLHAFYIQKSSNLVLEYNTIEDQSGAPFKIDEGSVQVLIYKNVTDRAGQEGDSQPGVVRIPCGTTSTCARDVVIDHNTFGPLWSGEGARASGGYFDFYRSACKKTCWQEKVLDKSHCPVQCRGVVFNWNEWNL